MVDREVDWPVWVVLGRRSGGGLGTYVGDLGPLLGLYVRSLVALGASIGGLGCTWAALAAYVGGLGPLLSPLPSPSGLVGANPGSPFISFFRS